MVYFGARYYDPDTARFITQDSYLGESGTPPSLHRYLYAYSNPTVYVDLYGYESVEYGDNGEVYWQVEEDGFLYNPDKNRFQIGTVKDGQVLLTQEYGGGLVAHEKLKEAASGFWNRSESVVIPSDISGLKESEQKGLVASYLDSTNVRGEQYLSAPGQERFSERIVTNSEKYAVGTRLGGAVKVGFGAAGAYASANSVLAAPAAVYFSDMAATGLQEVIGGNARRTNFNKGVFNASMYAGADEQTASMIANYTDLVVETGLTAGALRTVPRPNNVSAPVNNTINAGDQIAGIKVQQVRQGTNGKFAIIGRSMGNKNMKGVRDVYEELQARGLNVEIFDPPALQGKMLKQFEAAGKQFENATEGWTKMLKNTDVMKLDMYKLNKQWARGLKDNGYNVIDLGDIIAHFTLWRKRQYLNEFNKCRKYF